MNRKTVVSVSLAIWMLILATARPIRADERPYEAPPRRPADFKPLESEYTTEKLMKEFSNKQMERAAKELAEIQSVNEKGPWQPTCKSLDRHRAPEWFRDAKLGIMLNWGLTPCPRGINHGAERRGIQTLMVAGCIPCQITSRPPRQVLGKRFSIR